MKRKASAPRAESNKSRIRHAARNVLEGTTKCVNIKRRERKKKEKDNDESNGVMLYDDVGLLVIAYSFKEKNVRVYLMLFLVFPSFLVIHTKIRVCSREKKSASGITTTIIATSITTCITPSSSTVAHHHITWHQQKSDIIFYIIITTHHHRYIYI